MARTFDPVTLRLFIAVCEERSIARAAEREAIVASAVSKRIAAIEREIGTPGAAASRRRPWVRCRARRATCSA